MRGPDRRSSYRLVGLELGPVVGLELGPVVGLELEPVVGLELGPVVGLELMRHPQPLPLLRLPLRFRLPAPLIR